MTTITPHAPTLYRNYVLEYEQDFFHDIDQPPSPPTHFVLELCIKSSAHTIFVMTTTLPHAPTLYWNYVLGYEIRHTDHFCHDILCNDNDPTPCPPLYWNYVLGYK